MRHIKVLEINLVFSLAFSRAKDMVDVFKTHVQDAFSYIRHPVGNLENNVSDERFTATASNRAAIEKQRKRLVNKENEKQVSNSEREEEEEEGKGKNFNKF